MAMSITSRPGEDVLAVTGSFGADVAEDLIELLNRTASASERAVVIDLARATQISAVALHVLSDMEQALWARVRFRGLSLHHERILAHLRRSNVERAK